MGEFVECVQGIGEASKYLNFPVVSGNVSFYNETKDKGIKPTPTIGGIGLIKEYKKILKYKMMIMFVYQNKPLGTGDAVLKTKKYIDQHSTFFNLFMK